ncbi:MAG: GntR family transcriptional regulator, partial [Clostridiales bacterium]|nr:GntR family transcriptional regulator [Clostridiales bacterium]
MEEKRTLFDYLYRNLKEQILTGYLGYGELLPSLNGLCEIYNVGIRTAKDVIRAL